LVGDGRAGAVGAEVDEDAPHPRRLGLRQLPLQRRLLRIDREPRRRARHRVAERRLAEVEDVDEARVAGLPREEHLLRIRCRRRARRDLIERAVVVQQLEEAAASVEGIGAVCPDDRLRHERDRVPLRHEEAPRRGPLLRGRQQQARERATDDEHRSL